MKDAQEFRKAKKRKKLIKKLILMTTVIVIGGFIFITKAPIFNIKTILFTGNVTISKDILLDSIKDKLGLNIFTVNQKEIKDTVLKNKYVSTVKVKRKGINTLQISITEESPVYYINNGAGFLILNNNLDIVEETDTIEGRRLVEIKGIDLTNISEENIELAQYKNILTKFYPYISENREEIYISSLDISNIVNIIGYIGDVQVLFGDDSNLHEKMENVYRIILDDDVRISKGYINVSFNGSPVIKIEEVEENGEKINEESLEGTIDTVE